MEKEWRKEVLEERRIEGRRERKKMERMERREGMEEELEYSIFSKSAQADDVCFVRNINLKLCIQVMSNRKSTCSGLTLQ